MTFKEFMKQVNSEALRLTGLGVHDFADFPFREAFDEGADPKEVVLEALENDDIGCAMLDVLDL